MNQLKEIYNLKKDIERIKKVQEASLNDNSRSGYKIENQLLFGTNEWFNAIKIDMIQKHVVKGIISKVYTSGHDDFPEFEIENNECKTTWTREGLDSAYKVGRNIELIYVEQKYKRPSDITGAISKCVILIKITE
jgi:hypothetical protein